MAGRRIDVHPAAIAEARAARERYAAQSELLGEAFVDELDRAIASIAEAPRSWPPYLAGTRRFLFRRFPFSPVYRIVQERIEVIALAHGRREPGYWRAR